MDLTSYKCFWVISSAVVALLLMASQMKKASKSPACQTAQNHCLCPLPKILTQILPQINKQIAPFLNSPALPLEKYLGNHLFDDSDDNIKLTTIDNVVGNTGGDDDDAGREEWCPKVGLGPKFGGTPVCT